MRFSITPILGLTAMATAAVASPFPFNSVAIGPRSMADGTSLLSTRSFEESFGLAAHETLHSRALPRGSLAQPRHDKRALVWGILHQINPAASKPKKDMHMDHMNARLDAKQARKELRLAEAELARAKKRLDMADPSKPLQYNQKKKQAEAADDHYEYSKKSVRVAENAAITIASRVKNKEWRNKPQSPQSPQSPQTPQSPRSPQSGRQQPMLPNGASAYAAGPTR